MALEKRVEALKTWWEAFGVIDKLDGTREKGGRLENMETEEQIEKKTKT